MTKTAIVTSSISFLSIDDSDTKFETIDQIRVGWDDEMGSWEFGPGEKGQTPRTEWYMTPTLCPEFAQI